MKHYECLIIGKGPAGISCSLYTVRANISTLVIAKDGGALAKTHALENYYGFENPISGPDLLNAGLSQAKRLGVEILEDEVTSIEYGETYIVSTKSGDKYTADCLFLGLGASRTTTPIKNLANLEGKGVSYCAVCDGFFYRDKQVAVIGKGAYALHEALELAAVVDKVFILTNGEEPEVEFPDNFVVYKEKIKEIEGEAKVEGVIFKDGEKLSLNGIFMAIGTASGSDFAKKLGLDVVGKKLVVDVDCQTNVPGIYAGGDTTEGLMQVARAVSNGAVAAQHIIKTIRAKRKNK